MTCCPGLSQDLCFSAMTWLGVWASFIAVYLIEDSRLPLLHGASVLFSLLPKLS